MKKHPTLRELREKLKTESYKKRSPVSEWFAKNPPAQEFVELWNTMNREGETTWSHRRVYLELVAEYGFPYGNTGFCSWWNRMYLKVKVKTTQKG